jgi:hypothetical protein
VKENNNKNSNGLFDILLDQKVKVKYIDEGHTKSISGTVKNADAVYLVLERPEGDPMFINHSIVSRIIPLGDIEWGNNKYNHNKDDDDGYHIKSVDERKKEIIGGDENGRRKNNRRQNRN